MRGRIATWVLGAVTAVGGLPAGAATIVVETEADSLSADGLCSLREAIRAANLPMGGSVHDCSGSAGVDTILLAAGTYTLSIPRAVPDTDDNFALTGDLDIRDDLTIRGSGGAVTIVDGGAIDRVLHVDPAGSGIEVHLEDLTVRNGLTPVGENAAGILNEAGGVAGSLVLDRVTVTGNAAANSDDAGVGIYNCGSLVLLSSQVSANGGAGGAGIFNENGADLELHDSQILNNTSPLQAGGIDNQGTVEIHRSLIAGNTATQFQGGGLLNAGQATIQNTTFSGNSAGTSGGALYNDPGATADLVQVTMAENTAAVGGGGIFNEDTVNIGHSILADNTGGNCAGANAPVSDDYNLEDANDCGLNAAANDLINTDPDLDPLADNGGFTLTYALLPSSPAVDTGGPGNNGSVFDQRLFVRTVDGTGDGINTQDRGAFELEPPPIIVNVTGDGADVLPSDGVCEAIVGSGLCTLRAAVQNVSPAGTIQLGAGVYVLSIPGRDENASATGDLDLVFRVTIEGAGVDATVIESQMQDRILDIRSTAWLELSDLTLRGGTAVGESGGCIRSESQWHGLILRNVRVEDCSADVRGGGISLDNPLAGLFATATLIDSTISGNSAIGGSGGGIFAATDSLLLLHRSSVIGNQAPAASGGGLEASRVTLINSTVSGNTADNAGGIFTFGPALIEHGTVAYNVATSGDGGGLFAGGQTFLHGSLLAHNTGDPDSENCTGNLDLFSRGFNLENLDSCELRGSGDQPSADPKLVPLADNGGPTRTHALALSSAAIDMGDPAACPPTDQRGIVRPEDGDGVGGAACDIGAFEGLACQPLVLADHTIDSAVDYTACESITLRNLVFGSGADADLTAGDRLIAENGTVFAAGSQAVLAIDPALGMAPP